MRYVLLVLDVAILAAVALFCAISLSHIGQAWHMRKDLQVHMRSSGLATLSGLSGTLMFMVTVFRFILNISIEEGAIDLFLLPILITLYTGAYVMRGFRLVVMYNPHMRKHWGRSVKEAAIMRNLGIACFVLEAATWSATSIVGVQRVADLSAILFLSDTFLTIVASCLFFGMLRKTNDIYKMSIEIRRLGAFALLALCSSSGYIAVQSPYLMLLWMMVRFQSALWITNIQPIREILRSRARRESGNGSFVASFFPYLPWKTQPRSKVAVSIARPTTVAFRSPDTSGADACSALERVMHVPPLLQAFEEYCRKALCIESLMFLLAADAFRGVFAEAPAPNAEAYERYIAIVNKYIRERSPYEVNIESKTKRDILRTTDRGIFDTLTVAERSRVLDRAVKEVGKILKDNLYDRFCATEEYKQIQDQLDALEQVGE